MKPFIATIKFYARASSTQFFFVKKLNIEKGKVLGSKVIRLSNLGIRSNYYGLIFILSIIGAILFIFTEFGGYTTYYKYSVNLESSFRNPDLSAFAPLLVLVSFFFVLNIFLSLKGLNIIKTSLANNSAKLGFYSSLGILVITAVGGIVFEIILSDSGATDWWLNSGFYAGLIGGILLPLLYYFIMKNSSAKTYQATYPPPPPPLN
jgi:hypothetical protein